MGQNSMVLSQMRSYRLYVYGGGSAVCVTIGITLLCLYLTIVKSIFYQHVKLVDGGDSFIIWRDTPVPQTMSFYLYNWTNPEEVMTEKPRLNQMGPYVFKVTEKKTNVTWNNNGTITFKVQRTWFYDHENSAGSLEDEVTSLNAVAMSAANAVRYTNLFLKKGLSTSMWATGQKLYIRHKVGELLFYGYTDPLLEMAKELPAFEGIEIPPYDRFGWFYLRNGSNNFEGTFEMETGSNDIFSFGVLRNWNFENKTSFYNLPCGYVNGSAGELFPPERSKDNIQMFSADLCRSISLNYKEEVEIRGVKGYKYVGDKYTFDNGTLDPGNKCFCGGECLPSGVLNVTACRFGSPGFVSFPHFYHADPFYTDQVEGLRAAPEAHEMYITLEPTTGIPLDVAARFQINIRLSPVQDIELYKDVPTIYFPMIWFEQKATITEELAFQVQLVLYLPLVIQCIGGFLLLVGIVLSILTIYLIVQPTVNDEVQDFKLTEGTIEPLISNGNQKPMIIEKGSIATEK